MRLRGLRVNGLGMLVDTGIEEIQPGLVVILGPNGAGKSTFLEFINSLLFGFQKGQGANKFVDTLGGLRGGYATFEDSTGRVLRWELSPSTLAGGNITVHEHGKPIEHRDLLGSATRDLYDAVFALNLDDLSVSVNKDLQQAVEAAITGMGVSGLPKAIKATTEELKVSTNRIRDLTQELKEAEAQLSEAKERTRRYDLTVEAQREASEKVSRLSRELAPLKEAAESWKQLQLAWTPWCQLQQEQARLEELPVSEVFEAGARERLKSLRDRQTELSLNLREQKAEVEDLQRQLQGLDLAPEFLLHSSAIESLSASLQILREIESARPTKQQQLANLRQRLQHALAEISPSWDEDRLRSFDSSVAVQAEANRTGRAVSEAAQAVSQTAAECEKRAGELREAERDHQELAEGLSALQEVPNQEELDRRSDALAQLRAAIEQATRAEAQIPAPSSDPVKPDSRKTWILAAIVTVAVVLGAILTKAYALILLGPVLGLLVVAAFRSGAGSSPRPADLDSLCRERDRARQSASQICERYGWTSEDLPSIAAEIQRLRAKAQEWQNLSMKVADAQRRKQTAAERLEDARRIEADRNRASADAKAAWKTWTEQRAYPEGLQPEDLPLFDSRLVAARLALSEWESAKAGLDADERRLVEASCALKDIEATLGAERGAAGVSDSIAWFARRLKAAEEADRAAAQLEREIAAVGRRIEATQAALNANEEQIATLHQLYGVDSDEAFETAFRTNLEGNECRLRIDQAMSSLTLLGGPGEGVENLMARLAEIETGFDLDNQAAAATCDADDCERLLETAKGEQVRLTYNVEQLEQGADLGAALAKTTELRVELESARSKWLELTLSKILLEEAKARFQDQVQDSVFKKASEYMSSLTGGRSVTIRQEGETYVLVDRDERKRTLDQLNRSHKERLLLAVRLAYIDHYCLEKEPLPVILDDILVNFDADHRDLAAKTIAEFAQRHQVLYLTCHPATLNEFGGQNASFQLVRLEQWKFSTAGR